MYCLHFPANPRDPGSDSYALVTPGPHGEEDAKNAVNLKAQDTQLVRKKRDMVIYRAKLHSDEIPNSPISVVCKCAYGPSMKSLSQETEVYQTKLNDLQGFYIPRFLGLYNGQHPDGYTVTIMVLSDEGRPVSVMLKYTPLYFRKRVLDCLMKIHQAGIEIGELEERNIVAQKREDLDAERPWIPMIIDFGRARKHKCKCAWREVIAYDYAPDRYDFKCDELWWAFQRAELWQPESIHVLGQDCPASWIDDGVEAFAQKVDWLLREVPESERLTTAQKLIDEYYSWGRERRKRDENPVPPVCDSDDDEYDAEEVEDEDEDEDDDVDIDHWHGADSDDDEESEDVEEDDEGDDEEEEDEGEEEGEDDSRKKDVADEMNDKETKEDLRIQ